MLGSRLPYLEFEYLQLREIVPVLLPKLILVTVLVPLDEILRQVWRTMERQRLEVCLGCGKVKRREHGVPDVEGSATVIRHVV